MSRSYGPGRYDYNYEEKGIDYPIGYVRWTEKRNMESFLSLLSKNKVPLEELITHEFEFNDSASEVYNNLSQSNELILGSVFKYNVNNNILTEKITNEIPPKYHSKKEHNIGLIGAGSYAQSFLLPRLKKFGDVNLVGVCTNHGEKAKHISEKYGFNYSTTLDLDIIDDDEIDTVFILTRHNTHADLVSKLLISGKNVFVEKPLAINIKELDNISDTFNSSDMPNLIVGYNRRFSKHTDLIRNEFKDRVGPLIINYRVNAEKFERDHWFFDKEIGGGRIVSESCHFIDFCQFLIGCEIIDSNVICAPNSTNIPNNNDIIITLKFSDGSIASITYHSIGGKSLPKERIEVSGENKSIIVDDFINTTVFSGSQINKFKTKRQSKGRAKMLEDFFKSIKLGKSLISINDLISTTRVTIDLEQS